MPNLYFVGAGTHPGAGIPGVLSSGKISGGFDCLPLDQPPENLESQKCQLASLGASAPGLPEIESDQAIGVLHPHRIPASAG